MTKSLDDAHFHAIKSATRDLVMFVGGLDRAKQITGLSRSTLSRWQVGDHADLINLAAVIALETECGIPAVTKVMARFHGRRLSESGDAGQGASPFMDLVSALHASQSETTQRIVDALADMKITPTEADLIERCLADDERARTDIRKTLSDIKAGNHVQIVGAGG